LKQRQFSGPSSRTTWWASTRNFRNTNPIHHLHCPQISHKHSQPFFPGLPVYI